MSLNAERCWVTGRRRKNARRKGFSWRVRFAVCEKELFLNFRILTFTHTNALVNVLLMA